MTIFQLCLEVPKSSTTTSAGQKVIEYLKDAAIAGAVLAGVGACIILNARKQQSRQVSYAAPSPAPAPSGSLNASLVADTPVSNPTSSVSIPWCNNAQQFQVSIP